jgi:hypothetical protein
MATEPEWSNNPASQQVSKRNLCPELELQSFGENDMPFSLRTFKA